MKRNTKTMLLAGIAVLAFITIVVVMLIVLRPFFNLANVVSGGN
ncbi:MAG: hypothetical protein RL616_1571 [Verrucomicrobiota bacterium]